MELLLFIVIILLALTLLYWVQMGFNFRGSYEVQPYGVTEAYIDYITALEGSPPDSFLPDAGNYPSEGIGPDGQQVALKDFLTVKPGLTSNSAASCASSDTARQGELGGQYVQRTNNYKRDYPDNCSAPRSEFAGSVYQPVALGASVPCDGSC
jgi:hypothetical protein